MKKLIIIQLLFLFVCSYSQGQNDTLTADEIWGKYLENCGEKDVVLNVKTFSSKLIAESEYGKMISKIKIKYPDKVFMEMTIDKQLMSTYIFNGDSGIIKSPQGIEAFSEIQIARFKEMALIFPEMHYKELGYKIKLLGEVIIGNKVCYNLQVKNSYETVNYIIDKSNFDIFRTENDDMIMEILESKIIKGVNLIMASKSIVGNETLIGRYTLHEMNKKIKDSVFELK